MKENQRTMKLTKKQIASALGDSDLAEPIQMLLKNTFAEDGSSTSAEIADSITRCLADHDAFYEALLYFELNHYEVYLAVEERVLPFKQFYFRGSNKPTNPQKRERSKKKFRNTRSGQLTLRLPVASFLFHYLRFISKLSNPVIAFLTGLAMPFCTQAMRIRLKKAIAYMKADDPLLGWFKRLFDKKVIDPRISKRFVKNILGRWLFVYEDIEIPAPYFISISPSTVCNLRCIGCYAGEYENSSLTKEQVNDLLAQTRNIGTHIVCLTGGEPFLYPHLFEVIEANRDLFFLLFTNGTHIDEEVCQRLKALGNAAVLMSIEGREEETDTRRGKGVYQKIMEASRLLKENRIIFGFSIMAASNNGATTADHAFYQHLYDCGAMILWYTTYLPVGTDRNLALLPTPQQRYDLKNALQKVRHTLPMFIIDFENDSSYVGGCAAAGRRVLHINSKGQIEPCNYFHYYQHTIEEAPIAKAINSSFFQLVRERQPFCRCGYTPCLFDCNLGTLKEILSTGLCKPSYPNDEAMWDDPDFIKFSNEYRNAIQQLYLENAIKAFAEGGTES